MLKLNLYHDIMDPFFDYGIPILCIIILLIRIGRYVIPLLKIKKAFDNGLEKILREKISNRGLLDAYKIEFREDAIYFTFMDERVLRLRFCNIDYANLPNIRYTQAMAKEYKNRFLAGQKAKIYKSTSSIEGGYVTTGYNTTRTSDGYHTEEARSYVSGSTTVLGYEIINYDVKRANAPKIQPPKNKW